ncbi:uncharacterized protein N7482_006372 [Penicillium canariense]|uniref:Uncharacterized protein n=1 Tax=Penicillium canariense TaxID=189055 RepID=A0A9W9HUY1_9EURO|nr:uncharacterized protein N7482_006372 [Penicillium canariense]KAJ5159368.1 hypothetical protein N7482_006372 [Penicillium canariense]
MDWFPPPAPATYQPYAHIADLAQLGQGLGWGINYALMAYISHRDQTYGMSVLPLCCNFAWEITYAVVYPPHNPIERFNVTLYLVLNVFIMAGAVRFAPREWAHAPFVQRNLFRIFTSATLIFLLAHIALAKTVGVGRAANWGAFFCLDFLVAGAWCQLLGRGSSRGASYGIWASRFIGSYVSAISVELRRMHWPEAFGWLEWPMVRWHMVVCVLLDVGYVLMLRHVKKKEQKARKES